ncbi:MAG: Yip1 domain protein [Firmicutes bacterium ADurb.Bin456]|nr:MAG: Yip1 domain protein [Firmicutes bacterium ADurb.Bin456]
MNKEIPGEAAGGQDDSDISVVPLDNAGPDLKPAGTHGESPDGLPVSAGPETGEGVFPGFLELVYGVFFEPRPTMKKVAARPPLGQAALVVTILSALSSLMWLLTTAKILDRGYDHTFWGPFVPALQVLAPLAAVTVFLWGYLKWFVNSSFISLVAELMGGQGRAKGVFAAAGLAELPAILSFPVQFVAFGIGAGSPAGNLFLGLAGLAAAIWSIALKTMAVGKIHGLSTGRSLLAVLSPCLTLLAFFIFLLVVTAMAITAVPSGAPLWNKF